jgi:hypothetical protein
MRQWEQLVCKGKDRERKGEGVGRGEEREGAMKAGRKEGRN